MDALKNKINDLQSPSIKHDRRSPTVIQSRVSAPPTNSPPNVPTSSEDPLELRRKKREQERKKFQNFLKAQRQSQVLILSLFFMCLERSLLALQTLMN